VDERRPKVERIPGQLRNHSLKPVFRDPFSALKYRAGIGSESLSANTVFIIASPLLESDIARLLT
jgi:hypothetical protein